MTQPTQSDTDSHRELTNLLHHCAQGRQSALQRLYELTSAQLFALLLRILKRRDLAEEALQDAFLSVWRNSGSYNGAKGAPMTWLVSICRHRALDMLRRDRREVHIDPESEMQEMAETPYGENTGLLSHAEVRALQQCLDELSEGQRHSIQLAYFDGCTHLEIAQSLSSPLGTVKSWVRRGLQALKGCLERLEQQLEQ
jgi:RNA polymerase sigma-70 factor (ECF subfamily)